MFRIITIAAVTICSVMVASAGEMQIQVGGANGLTSAYVASGVGSTTTCPAFPPSANGCGAATEQNYQTVLFSNANAASALPGPGETLTDTTHNVTFSMINQGGNASDNFWQLAQNGCTGTGTSLACNNSTITVPVGVAGVTDVWTMINTELAQASTAAVANYKEAVVNFYFGTSANEALASDEEVSVKLTNSQGSSCAAYGQTQNAVLSSATSCANALPLSSGPTSAISAVIAGVTVDTGTVYSSTYNGVSAASPYVGTSGTVVLDDQGFFFNGLSLAALGAGDTNLNTYLVAVQVEEFGNTNGVATGLSAITVDAIPEPATAFLFLTGLGAIGFARFRRR